MALADSKSVFEGLTGYDVGVGVCSGLLAMKLSGTRPGDGGVPMAIGLASGALGILVYEIMTREFKTTQGINVERRMTNSKYGQNHNDDLISELSYVSGQPISIEHIVPGLTRVRTMNTDIETASFIVQETLNRRTGVF